METIRAREIINESIREFFKKQGFIEVETPLLVPSPDTAPYNEVFETILGRKTRAFLAPSPEFFMKRLIADGYSKIFQICKSFRNPTEIDPLHNPEFTILEWYRTKASYTDLMTDCENLINNLFKSLNQKSQMSNLKCQIKDKKTKNVINYQDKLIDISTPWVRTSVKEAFKKHANINLDEFLDFNKAKIISRAKGYRVEETTTWEQLYHQIFLNEIEPRFPQDRPLILYDYPAALAALSRLKATDPRYAERFEFYIGSLELGNGYSELTDWQEQERRLINDIKIREEMGKKVFDYDQGLVEALKRMPETAGIAVGVDRLIMLFTDIKTIQEVIPYSATNIFSLPS